MSIHNLIKMTSISRALKVSQGKSNKDTGLQLTTNQDMYVNYNSSVFEFEIVADMFVEHFLIVFLFYVDFDFWR
jgi:hypothetical protein